MPRPLFYASLAVAALVLATSAFFYLSYGADAYPSRATLRGLAAPAHIEVYDGDTPPLIQASTREDALLALGYAQATTLTWPLVVARQAARGELSLWKGRDAIPLDRHAALLGFFQDAVRAEKTLAPDARAALTAFATGVSAGLGHAWRHDRFVALTNIPPVDSFTVTDILAIEQLFAWTATEVAWQDSTIIPAEARAFLAADSLFRRALGTFGWSDGAAWSFTDTMQTYLTARFETGQSALPALYESLIVVADDTSFAAFVPGTPFAVARVATTAGVVVPRGRAMLHSAAPGAWESDQQALKAADGSLVSFRRLVRPNEVLLAPDTTAGSQIALVRPAQRGTTDASAWLSFGRGGAPETIALLPESTLLYASRTGTTSRYGFGMDYARGELTAGESAISFLRVRLDTLAVSGATPPPLWYQDATSPWAVEIHKVLVSRIDTALFTSPAHHTAFEYFRNWSGSYRGTSIGATVFDALAERLNINAGDNAAFADTSQPFIRARYTEQFATTTDSLVRRYGTDPLGWRRELLHPDERRFPLWSIGNEVSTSFPEPDYVAPFTLPGAGHLTTLRGSTSSTGVSHAAHVLVLTPGAPLATRLYRLHMNPAQPFNRYRLEGHALTERLIQPLPAPAHTIALLPDAR